MPKMKTNKATKRRIKITGTGKYLARASGKNHILTKKSKTRKNRLNKDFTVRKGLSKKIDVLLAR